jgi:hypothetical protein
MGSMSPAPEPSPSLSRHPVTIGALESLRAFVVTACLALVVATAAWFVALAQQQPLSVVPVWAGTLVGTAAGWATEAPPALPPTLLTVGLVVLLGQAFGRTRRALAVNADLARAGRLPASPHAFLWGISTVVGASVVWVAVSGLLVGACAAGPLGTARFLTVLLCAGLLAFLRPARSRRERRAERRARRAARREQPPGRVRRDPGAEAAWAHRLTGWAEPRVGEDWAAAALRGLRLTGRTWVAFGILALLLVGTGLVLGRTAVGTALDAYSDPAAAAVGLTLVQLAFAPTIGLLALSWASGAGIWMSSTVLASPSAGFEGPVPAVPVLALVPADPPAWCGFLVVAPVLAAVLAAAARREWTDGLDWRTLVVHTALMCVSAGAGALFSRGGIGPEGLEQFGAPVLLMTALLTACAAVGAAAVWGLRLLAERRGEE